MSDKSINNIKNALNNKEAYERDITEYARILRDRSNKNKIDDFCKLRAFDKETVEDCGIFYIAEMNEMLVPSHFDRIDTLGVISETNKKPIFNARWVIPIKNSNGLIENFVGYSPYADERYIYGTARYYRRRETLYGLENIEMAYDLGYAFVTEGITDTIRLRDMGFKNSFAMCGTHSSDYIIEQLNRCRNGVILIPDRDKAGLSALKGWKFNRSIVIYIHHQFKDLDEMCSIRTDDGNKIKNDELIETFKECANYCIDWVKSDEHRGKTFGKQRVTII
ncbi:MAG: toprim domain-containing protein [Lachnospiraceae bacterium]|nr:toprim domain-containing protein [Lachnospiraceae bacterium]